MLFGGVTLPGRPDLCNVALLDRLPIPFIRQAQRAGFAIDREYFRDLSSRFAAEMVELERDIASYIPPDRLYEFAAASQAVEEEGGDAEFNANSAEQIGKLLFDMLGIGIGKQLKRTKQGNRVSTGKRQLEQLSSDHPVVAKVQEYRQISKLKSGYCDSLPEMARYHPRGDCCPVCEWKHEAESWRVHGEMTTTRADTGRLSHKKPNNANLPIRTERGQLIRAGYIAPPGKRIVTRDLSQIELRCLAHLSADPNMIEVYEAGGDLHDATARALFDIAPDEKPDKIRHRLPCKRVNFSIQNGTTYRGLYAQLVMDFAESHIPLPDWLTEDWCKWFIKKWLDERPAVQEWFELQWYRMRRYGLVWDAFGRVKLIPEGRSCHSWIREAGLRYAQNMPITATAAGQLKLVMGKTQQVVGQFQDAGVQVLPLTSVHDQLLVEADEEAAGDVDEAMAWAFDSCMNDEQTGERLFRVPICSDGKVMERWKSD